MSKELTAEQVLDYRYNAGRMADWKVADTDPNDLLPWVSHEQAIKAINHIRLQDSLEMLKLFRKTYPKKNGRANDLSKMTRAELDAQITEVTMKLKELSDDNL